MLNAMYRTVALFVTEVFLVFVGFTIPAIADFTVSNECNNSYNHSRYAFNADIVREYDAFIVSFDSKDDDDGDNKPDLRRTPEWVAQHIKRAEKKCIKTHERPKWSTDNDLYTSGVAPNDDSYEHSGFDRGHMASKFLAARISKKAELETFTVLNAVPQRIRFNRQVWMDLEKLTGAWAQIYGDIWVIQGPVYERVYDRKNPKKTNPFTIGDKNELKVSVPDAIYKIVVREKTQTEQIHSVQIEKYDPEILVFLYPQLGPRYHLSKINYEHEKYLTTLAEIEKLTGLTFINNSPKRELDELSLNRIRMKRTHHLWSVEPPADRSDLKIFISACSKKK